MHAEAERLAEAFIRDFWAANRQIRWFALEQEHSLWLDHDTVLVGRVDAIGETPDGQPFFADWKTGSKNKARYIEAEKRQWRFTPQALTYGVLLGVPTTEPYTNDSEINVLAANQINRFTVRWALKTEPATTAFEWYEYTETELRWWREELLAIAFQIRMWRDDPHTVNWPTNLHNCLRYGEKYACPFWAEGCPKLNFSHVPESMKPRTESHLALENELRARYNENRSLVVLDASRVSDWMSCGEFYRRLWENGGLTEESEALTIGSDFHSIIAAHLTQIAKETK